MPCHANEAGAPGAVLVDPVLITYLCSLMNLIAVRLCPEEGFYLSFWRASDY